MIYESLIAPTESITNLRDIKKALLTYDKVKLIDPSDRDVIPANSLLTAVFGMPPIFGGSMGAVMPLGKKANYDNSFQRVIELCKPAVEEGLVEVISTYNVAETNTFTIGRIPTGGYPLNPNLVFWVFREFSKNHDFLNAAINKDKSSLLSIKDKEQDISTTGIGSYKISNIPELPEIVDQNLDKDSRAFLSQIARARIASFIKYGGFCEQKNLIPIFPSDVYGDIAAQLINNINGLLSNQDNVGRFWLQRNRVLKLCHEEYLEDVQLDKMRIQDILKFRTRLWGDQAEAREELFNSISNLANDIEPDKIFNEKAVKCIKDYKKVASQLERERKTLKYQIKSDIAGGLLRVGGVGLSGEFLVQIESPFVSVAATLIAGGIWAIDKTKKYVPELKKLTEQENEFNWGAGLGIQNFYSRLQKAK